MNPMTGYIMLFFSLFALALYVYRRRARRADKSGH